MIWHGLFGSIDGRRENLCCWLLDIPVWYLVRLALMMMQPLCLLAPTYTSGSLAYLHPWISYRARDPLFQVSNVFLAPWHMYTGIEHDGMLYSTSQRNILPQPTALHFQLTQKTERNTY